MLILKQNKRISFVIAIKIDTVYEKKQKMEALINQKLSEYDYGSLIGGSEEFKEWEK